MPGLSQVCRCCVADGVPRRSLIVALFVGTLLNLINQGDTLFSGEHINLVKLLLTYTVPYGVATYGAVSFRLTRPRNALRPRPDDSTEKSGQ
ncbi:MAG: nitrate/nitrite transporter NrtS [Salinisphaera sp.]|jgi:hypothetical protein|nr:nitrate/nitrite transporter NrtS [Salinisphaera sp.]